MAADWQTSLDLVAALQAEDGPDVAAPCTTQALLHEGPAEEAVLLLHGYTNAPPQWREIASAYFEAGANVLVPRVPFHGLADPLNKELSHLTPQVLAEFTDRAVEAAEGLGTRLRVAGLSLGGLLAAYAAKHHDSVAEAALIAPFFQPKAVPTWVDAPFDAAMRALPDVYSWWNPAKKEAEVRGTWAYPKFSMKAIAAMIAMRRDLERDEPRRTNKAERVVLVINEHDIAIRNDVAEALTKAQFAELAGKLDIVVVPGDLCLTHDLVEPNGDNRDRMDDARAQLWPALGLTPWPAGTPSMPIPGGGYFADGAPAD
jgi:esterase/lipase